MATESTEETQRSQSEPPTVEAGSRRPCIPAAPQSRSALSDLCVPSVPSVALRPPHGTLTGLRSQMSRAYSEIVRSLENLPMRAVLRIAIFAQRRLSR